ncbi:hypothetical protein ABK040_006996 [Willaertia magna]
MPIVTIKSLNGKSYDLLANESDTILYLKKILFMKFGISIAKQRLICNGKNLKDFSKVKSVLGQNIYMVIAGSAAQYKKTNAGNTTPKTAYAY